MDHQAVVVTVHIWPLTVSAERLGALRALLAADELARADRIRVPEVARDFIAGRGIVRELLAIRCGCEPQTLRFGAGPQGKPYLSHPSTPLAFNVTHSGGYCALAAGNVARLGVDIEAIRPTTGDLASSVFTPGEAARYAAVHEADRLRTFFRAWVAKEAYLKATGEGLAGGLTSLEVKVTSAPDISVLAIRGDTTAPPSWRFHGFDVSDMIVGALAANADGSAVAMEIHSIDPEHRPK